MVVPEFPQSRASGAAWSRERPPWTTSDASLLDAAGAELRDDRPVEATSLTVGEPPDDR